MHKYLADEASPEERREVDAWIESDERNEEFMKSLLDIWNIEPGDNIEVDARKAWESFKYRLADERRAGSSESEDNIFRLSELRSPEPAQHRAAGARKRVLAVSLTAAAVLLIAFLFYQFSPLGAANLAISSQDLPNPQEITTERGQRTNLRLFDGSRVQLNAESELRIPTGFGDTARVVHLRGQAYFEVTHNPEMPFIVYSGNSLTRVLGTKFDVKAYPEDLQVQVVVEEGRVALGTAESKETIAENHQIGTGQIGYLNEDGQTMVANTSEIERYLGWKDGRLIFDSATFEDVIQQLQRWYDVKIKVADSSAMSKKLTASFKNEPMTEVMNIISLSLDLRYEREGRIITFHVNR